MRGSLYTVMQQLRDDVTALEPSNGLSGRLRWLEFDAQEDPKQLTFRAVYGLSTKMPAGIIARVRFPAREPLTENDLGIAFLRSERPMYLHAQGTKGDESMTFSFRRSLIGRVSRDVEQHRLLPALEEAARMPFTSDRVIDASVATAAHRVFLERGYDVSLSMGDAYRTTTLTAEPRDLGVAYEMVIRDCSPCKTLPAIRKDDVYAMELAATRVAKTAFREVRALRYGLIRPSRVRLERVSARGIERLCQAAKSIVPFEVIKTEAEVV